MRCDQYNCSYGRFFKCRDCLNLDRVSEDFSGSNLCKCWANGREHWIGDDACDCDSFLERSASRVASCAGN
jgi:hypothetical protein